MLIVNRKIKKTALCYAMRGTAKAVFNTKAFSFVGSHCMSKKNVKGKIYRSRVVPSVHGCFAALLRMAYPNIVKIPEVTIVSFSNSAHKEMQWTENELRNKKPQFPAAFYEQIDSDLESHCCPEF
ncbi:MAG: hypothetical protein HKK67_09885 [Chlorobiaceae bacterium]|nr:hypothetical protein [Chlorobiaceae bacterium]